MNVSTSTDSNGSHARPKPAAPAQPAPPKKQTEEIVFEKAKTEVKIIELRHIDSNVWNMRTAVDKGSVEFLELASSLATDGQHQNLIVVPKRNEDGTFRDDRYELVAGHRRYHAWLSINKHKALCTVRFFTNEIQVILCNMQENLLRKAPTPYEVAMGCKRLRDAGKGEVSTEQIAKWLHKSQSYVGKLLMLTEKLIPELQAVFQNNSNEATVTQLVALAGKDPETQKLHAEAIKEGRILQDEEKAAQENSEMKEPKEKDPRPKVKSRDAVKALLGDLKECEGIMVRGNPIMLEEDAMEAVGVIIRWCLGELKRYPLVLPPNDKEREFADE